MPCIEHQLTNKRHKPDSCGKCAKLRFDFICGFLRSLNQICFQGSSFGFPFQTEMFGGLRLVANHGYESILVQKMALQWQHEIRLVPVLFQRLLQVRHQVHVDLPALPAHVVVELAGGGEGGEEVGQHAHPRLRVLQRNLQNILQLRLPLFQVTLPDVEK